MMLSTYRTETATVGSETGTSTARRLKRIERAAYRAAGHAFVGYYLFGYRSIERATRDLHDFVHNLAPEPSPADRIEGGSLEEDPACLIRANLAGAEAEGLLTGQRCALAHNERDVVHELSLRYGPQETDTRVAWMRYLRLSTRDLLWAHFPEVKALANAILERETLSAEEIERICLEAAAAVQSQRD